MNIYTLHKEGSFRPPALDCDSEIENSLSAREKHRNPNLQIVAEENDPHCSETSDTSGSGHSSSLGEKTTPRQNVTPSVTKSFTYDIPQNSRVSASRIDATGFITGTNTSQLLPSKAISNIEPKAKQMLKNSAYSSFELKKGKRNGLIHIQARDEFMIFEDNTDLVSHITTPSAVRTSPLESEFLVIDHEEFAEEDDLFSAITVPKALRKKKNKNKRKSKLKNDGSRNEEHRNKDRGKSSNDKEQEELRLVPSTSTDDTEEEEPQDVPTSPPTTIRRQNSLDLPSSQPPKPSDHNSLRSPKIRGGRREPSPKADEMPMTPPMTKEDMDVSSQDYQEKFRPSTPTPPRQLKEDYQEKVRPSTPTPPRQLKEVKDENMHDSQQEQQKKLPEEETSKSPRSISQKEITETIMPATSLDAQERDSSKTFASIVKAETIHSTPEKSLVSQGLEQGSGQRDDSKKSPEPVVMKNSKKSSRAKDHSQAGIKKVSDHANRGAFVAKAASYGIDLTERTVIDSTAVTLNEAESTELGKTPNSRRRGKSFMWWLPTSHFCPQRRKKKQTEETFSMRRTTSVPDYKSGNQKQERRNSK